MIIKNSRSLLATIFIVFTGLSLGFDAEASYFSYTQGNVKDHNFGGGAYGELKYEKNDGRYKELEFNWANKDQVGFATGVKLDTNNKVKDYLLGLVLPDESSLLFRQFTINDRLQYTNSPYDPNPGKIYVLGDINAQATEISYIKPSYGADAFSFTYGKSNLPQIIVVSTVAGTFGTQADLLVDVGAVTEYIMFGFNHNGLKNTLNNRADEGWDIFLEADVGFGLSRTTLGDHFHDWGTGQPSHTWKLAGQSGNSINVRGHFAPEIAYIFKAGGVRSAFKFGAYYDMEAPAFADILKLNKTTKIGYANDPETYIWVPGGRTLFGFFAGVGFAF